jgi:[ribosomal protein S5]-alanine N-acetyltransferase
MTGVLKLERVLTPRLTLEPISQTAAEAVLAGDLSGVAAGDGWPHADTLDGLRIALQRGHQPGCWFVVLDDVVIGDCGIHAEPDEAGDVELGYGLAAPYRGEGYGSEVVIGLSQWLLRSPEVRRVVARGVLKDNLASRRALERAGFELESADDRVTSYALSAPSS